MILSYWGTSTLSCNKLYVPDQFGHMNALDLARRKMEPITAKLLLCHTFQSKIQFSATYNFKEGDGVLIF